MEKTAVGMEGERGSEGAREGVMMIRTLFYSKRRWKSKS